MAATFGGVFAFRDDNWQVVVESVGGGMVHAVSWHQDFLSTVTTDKLKITTFDVYRPSD